MAMAASKKMRPLFYAKNNKIVFKFNNNTLMEEIKKQVSKNITYRINTYLIENNITIIKICAAQTLINKNITK